MAQWRNVGPTSTVIGTEAIRLCLAGMRTRQGAIIVMLLVLCGCSSQQDKELAAVKSAHSVAAEWAQVERLASTRKLPSAYAREMRKEAREELRSQRKALRDPAAPAAKTIDAVTAAPAPSAAFLAAAANQLNQAETQLEGQ
jgi:hypothetical protein